jgi:hypothetical protein
MNDHLAMQLLSRVAGFAFAAMAGSSAWAAEPVAEATVPPPTKLLWVVEAPRPHVLPTCTKWSMQLPGTDACALLRDDGTAKLVESRCW